MRKIVYNFCRWTISLENFRVINSVKPTILAHSEVKCNFTSIVKENVLWKFIRRKCQYQMPVPKLQALNVELKKSRIH